MKWLNDWLGFFKPLQVRNLQIFWSGQASALIGMWLQVTAMGILVYDISGGSATAVGVLAALNAHPFFLGGMLLAGLGDRFDRRKLLIAVQCVQWLRCRTGDGRQADGVFSHTAGVCGRPDTAPAITGGRGHVFSGI